MSSSHFVGEGKGIRDRTRAGRWPRSMLETVHQAWVVSRGVMLLFAQAREG